MSVIRPLYEPTKRFAMLDGHAIAQLRLNFRLRLLRVIQPESRAIRLFATSTYSSQNVHQTIPKLLYHLNNHVDASWALSVPLEPADEKPQQNALQKLASPPSQ